MRSIVTAMAMDKISINDLSIAEDKIVESINNEDRKNPVVKYSADYADGVLSTCLRCKAEALIISEKLTGAHDVVDIIKDVKNALPDITIIVLLLSEREVGDIMLSRLVMSGVYNWLSAPWRPFAIAEMVNHPRRLKDVEQYMPKLMDDGKGGFNAVIIKPMKATQDTPKVNKQKNKASAFHSVQSFNNDTPKDLNDIAPSIPQPNPLSKANSKTYKSLFTSNGNKFTDAVNVVRCKEIGGNGNIEFAESQTSKEDAPLFSTETMDRIVNNTNETSDAEPKQHHVTYFTDETSDKMDDHKHGERLLVDARNDASKTPTVVDPIDKSTNKSLEQHKAKPFQSNTFFAAQISKPSNNNNVSLSASRDLNAALKAAEALQKAESWVKDRREKENKDSVINTEQKSSDRFEKIENKEDCHDLIQSIDNDTKNKVINEPLKIKENQKDEAVESVDEKLRRRILSYIKRRAGKDMGDNVWDYFNIDPCIHNIVIVNLCSLRSSVPLFLMESFELMGKEPTLYDCSKDHALFSAANGIFKVKESRYLTVKNELNNNGLNIIYGTVGHSLKPLFDIADKLIIVCPSDTSMADKFMNDGGTFDKNVDMIVVEPSIDDTALKNLVQKYHNDQNSTYVKGLKVGGDVEGALSPSTYYALLNEGFGFSNNMCYLFQMNPLLLNMCIKKEGAYHE